MSKEYERERSYQKFSIRYGQGWSIEKIVDDLEISYEDAVGKYYLERFNRELIKERNKPKIDRKRMYELIHRIEKRYHIGDFAENSYRRGYTIKFDDANIPDDDPDYIELQKVVHPK